MANGNPSPGWYQDPRDPGQVRWWDGGRWTQNTQAMPGAAAPQPGPAQAQPVAPADPWAAAQQPAAQPGPGPEAWGQQAQQPAAQQPWDQQAQQPAAQQPGVDAWGQQPWGQQPQQPAAQQPGAEAWGQQPWGQQPQQPAAQQPGADAWGQQAQQPAAQQPGWAGGEQPGGGWQQPAGGGWGSAVAPGPVPQGLASGSPVGQANVFPTAETIDPITGMPVGSGDGGSSSSGKKLLGLVAGVILIGIIVIALLWFFLFRPSDTDSAAGTTGEVDQSQPYAGPVDPACADLGAALTADDLSSTVALRLNDVAVGKDLEENEAYFQQLGKDIKPIMDQYASTCTASVSAGNSPEFYRTFVETFESAVADGKTVATDALDGGGEVSSSDAERLRAEASKLEASAEAVVATADASSTQSAPSPTATDGGVGSGSPDGGSGLTATPSPIG